MTYNANLHMKTTLFLGAGASRFVDMPTTTDLVNDVLLQVLHRERWGSPMAASLARNIVRDHAGKDVEMLYKTIRDMKAAEELHRKAMKHKMDGDNHPSWKRELLTTSRYNPDNKTKKDETEDIGENIKTLESLELAIRNTLLDRLIIKPDHIQNMVEQYDALFEHVGRNIVTTNYDNVLETYCEQTRLNLVNGFKKSHLGDRRMWDCSWKDGKGSLCLVKLHGSIMWQKDDNDMVLEIGMPGLRGMDKDIMIPPTLGEKDYDHDIFPALWDRFKDMMSKTELLVVVGFSFRDPKINRILRSRLKHTNRKNPMRLLYVGPKDPKRDGLKELVELDDEPLKAPVPGKCMLWNYSRDKMPYVYAYRDEFGQDTARSMKFALEAMDELCGKASLGPD